jgi:hypothetical protein
VTALTQKTDLEIDDKAYFQLLVFSLLISFILLTLAGHKYHTEIPNFPVRVLTEEEKNEPSPQHPIWAACSTTDLS